MAKNKNNHDYKEMEKVSSKISTSNPAVNNSVISILLFVVGLFILLAAYNAAGTVGETIFKILSLIFGFTAYFLWIIFMVLGYRYWLREKYTNKINAVTILIILVMLFSLTTFTASLGLVQAGVVGDLLNNILQNNFGNILPSIISFAVLLISFIYLYQDRPHLKVKVNNEKLKEINNYVVANGGRASKNMFSKIKFFLANLFVSKKAKAYTQAELFPTESVELETENSLHSELMKTISKENQNLTTEQNLTQAEDNYEVSNIEKQTLAKAQNKSEAKVAESIKLESKPVVIENEFLAPSLTLLSGDSGKSSAGDSKFKMNVIQKVLNQFNIPVEMGEVTVGPSVTQFTLKPAQGVKIQKILSLKDNLQMALSATNMHIQAPIPGKPFVGIEIPNETKTKLGLRSLLELSEFQNGPTLSLAIGKDIIGKPVISNLSKMPHLLVAGATGTGKSVTLHNLILSLLYKNSPYDLKLIILDPKRVEFTAYNSLPHLYTPIIKDAKTAIKSLNWAAQEMDRRYDVLSEYGTPNLDEYNKKIFSPALEKAKRKANDGDVVTNLPPKMPYVVIVFDEFNDFMLSYPKEITPIITSLTQKARAAGIHLILTTQRPDVKVITGTIKANIPSRIALKTTSQIDSRTILDQAGAEDLLGNGDMLYMNGSRIIRVQAPFVSTEEIKHVIHDIKKKYADFLPDDIDLKNIKASSPSNGYKEMESEDRDPTAEPTDDEDYMSAKDYIISTGKASTSALQTAFRWGYNKAARLMNDLETYGVISGKTVGRYREVLANKNPESEVEKLERELSEMEEEKQSETEKDEETN